MLSDINTVCEQYAYRLIDTVDRSDADGGPTADDVALLLKEAEERFGVAGIVLTVTYLARKAAAGFAVIARQQGTTTTEVVQRLALTSLFRDVT